MVIMPATFDAKQILDLTEGRLAQGMLPEGSGRISTDTRSLDEGDWYLALPGEKFDGHDFLGDAFARGARGTIVAERPSYPIGSQTFPLLAVRDPVAAYQALARSWRKRVNPRVIGITGSSGKTTTKEMCAAVFAAGFRTHKSQANENNEIGVPKTILAMPVDTQVLVVEMAMRARGEIAALAATALPDLGIITNVGVAHLGPLRSIENIIAAKCELLAALSTENGVAIIGKPADDLLAHARTVFKGKMLVFDPAGLREIEVTPEHTVFELDSPAGGQKGSRFVVRAHGLAQLQDAWCAIMAGRQSALDDETIAAGLSSYQTVTGRGNRLVSEFGAVIVDEAYNGNPESVRASVLSFVDSRVFPQPNKYVVLGELAELGEQSRELHRDLGKWLSGINLTALITVGPVARDIADGAAQAKFEVVSCRDQQEAEQVLRSRLSHDSSVLIKGSHCAALDKLVARLVCQPQPDKKVR